MTGARATSRASRAVAAATCERSTSMPRRCISPHHLPAEGAQAAVAGVSVAASAQGTLRLWVSVR